MRSSGLVLVACLFHACKPQVVDTYGPEAKKKDTVEASGEAAKTVATVSRPFFSYIYALADDLKSEATDKRALRQLAAAVREWELDDGIVDAREWRRIRVATEATKASLSPALARKLEELFSLLPEPGSTGRETRNESVSTSRHPSDLATDLNGRVLQKLFADDPDYSFDWKALGETKKLSMATVVASSVRGKAKQVTLQDLMPEVQRRLANWDPTVSIVSADGRTQSVEPSNVPKTKVGQFKLVSAMDYVVRHHRNLSTNDDSLTITAPAMQFSEYLLPHLQEAGVLSADASSMGAKKLAEAMEAAVEKITFVSYDGYAPAYTSVGLLLSRGYLVRSVDDAGKRFVSAGIDGKSFKPFGVMLLEPDATAGVGKLSPWPWGIMNIQVTLKR